MWGKDPCFENLWDAVGERPDRVWLLSAMSDWCVSRAKQTASFTAPTQAGVPVRHQFWVNSSLRMQAFAAQ